MLGRRAITPMMVTCLLLLVALRNAEAQDVRLEVSVPKAKIKASEPVNLTVKLVTSPRIRITFALISPWARSALDMNWGAMNCMSGRPKLPRL